MKGNKKFIQRLKKTAGKLHLYLGLFSGAIVLILAITGACLSFQDEIRDWSANYKTVKSEDKPFITASKVKQIAQSVFPDKAIHGAVFGQKTEAIEVIFYESEPAFYQKVYLNPYSGDVLHIEDYFSGFLAFMLEGHTRLWLPRSIGSVLVSYGTFVFLWVIVSGLILWWPKNRRHFKQSLKLKWTKRTSPKKKVLTLHAFLGFYGSIFALLIAITGAIMGINWFYFIVFKAAGGSKSPRFIVPPSKVVQVDSTQRALALDALIPKIRREIPQHQNLELHYPDSDSLSVYVEVSYTPGVYYNSDYRFYDQYSLEELNPKSIYGVYAEADVADKVIRMAYDVHVGAILGLFGKIVMFLASLLIAILPVTGFLIWNRRRKERQYTA